MSRVLLVNPPSAIGVYDDSKIRVAITSAPFVTLASLAGAILEEGHEVMISDLMAETNPPGSYRSILESFSPEYNGSMGARKPGLGHHKAILFQVSQEVLFPSPVHLVQILARSPDRAADG